MMAAIVRADVTRRSANAEAGSFRNHDVHVGRSADRRGVWKSWA
jgi:hypothetical protein